MKQKNQLSNLIVSMTSLEIAEMTSKEHKNVLVDIRTMLDELKIDGLDLQLIYRDSMNRKQVMFSLPKRETLILVSGYSIELRTKIIDRLDYLEKENLYLRNELVLKEQARSEARLEYKPMSTALKETRAALGKSTEHFHYSNEANLINLVVFGATSKKLKEQLEITGDESLRDNFTALQIKAIQDIQKHNTTMLEMGLCYDARRLELNKIFNRKWADLMLDEHIRLES
jgi:phage regulator Rha-like protein